MRKILSPGEIIALRNGDSTRKIRIGNVLGDGATCIAYEAEHITASGISLRCRVKECYPFDAHIVRKGTELLWENESEKAIAFQRMVKAHNLLVQLRNDESIGNSVTSAELCEANGTLYSIMELNHAVTYEQDKNQQLPEILDTMRVLTEVVGKIHAQGYLHLDIKPGNFLVSHKPSTYIWLFDVDTLTSMDELANGNVRSVPYSQSWAAPEQFCEKIDRICPATDLYAIGAILFEKIMGRRVTTDDMSLFAKWDFDIELLYDVNPKIKRCLAEIFKKTLSASVKRRCQTADELLCLLEEAISISKDKIYLVSNCPPCTSYFQGRQKELQQIHEAFESGKRAVFLHGFGGIGKSEIAKKYAEEYATQYDAVLFLHYKGSLENLIAEIDIQNSMSDDVSHNKTLRRLLTKNILLIIDNFDVEVNKDPYLLELLRFNARILFTSRTDFSGANIGSTTQIDIGHLDVQTLTDLYMYHSGLTELNPTVQRNLEALFNLIEYHTLATELLAKQTRASGWSIETVLKKMETGLSSFDGAERIVLSKDERLSKSRLPDIMSAVFKVSQLTDEQQQCLRNLYMLQFVLVDARSYRYFVYGEWASFRGQGSLDDLNALEELGWIRQQNFGNTFDAHWCYTIHPLILQMIAQNLRPSVENCQALAATVFSSIVNQIEDPNQANEADRRQAMRTIAFLNKWLLSLDYASTANIGHLSAVLNKLMSGFHYEYWNDDIEVFANYCPNSLCEKLYDLLTSALSTTEQKHTISKALVWCDLFDSEHTERFQTAFFSVIETAKMVYAAEAGLAIQDFCELVFSTLEMRYRVTEIPNDVLEHAMKYLKTDTVEAVKRYISALQEPYPVHADTRNEAERYADLKYDSYLNEYHKKRDSIEIAIAVVNEVAFDIPRKVFVLDELLELSFAPVSSYFADTDEAICRIKDYVSNTNWENVQNILDLEMDLFKNGSWDWTPDDPFHYQNLFWRLAHITLINNDYSAFSEKIMYMKRKQFTLFYARGTLDFGLRKIVQSCFNLNRCHFLFPAVTDWVMEMDPPSTKTAADPHSAQNIYEMYETIQRCAEQALTEIPKSDERYTYIESVYREYSRVLKEIFDSPYKLRSEL